MNNFSARPRRAGLGAIVYACAVILLAGTVALAQSPPIISGCPADPPSNDPFPGGTWVDLGRPPTCADALARTANVVIQGSCPPFTKICIPDPPHHECIRCRHFQTWTVRVMDGCGNISSPNTDRCILNFTWSDPPTIGQPGASATIECPGTPVFTPPTATFDCVSFPSDPNDPPPPPPMVVEVSDVTVTPPGACPGTYMRTKTWVAVNCAGVESPRVSQTITVVDSRAPVIGPAGANTTVPCGGTVTFTPPTANDTCDSNPQIMLVSDNVVPGSCAGTYTETRTWKAVDCSGNESGTVSQAITVVDNTPPTIGSPGADATIACGATPNFTPPTANDTCSTATVNLVSDQTTPGECPGTYTQTRTWDATDACGNHSGRVSQSITVRCECPPSLAHCSLTQGAYGNAGGRYPYNGRLYGTTELLNALLATPMTVGKPGRSLRISSSACVLARLPGGGGASALPAIGDAVMSPDCNSPALPVNKQGRWTNSLLAQTVTLSLNTRYDTTLGAFGIGANGKICIQGGGTYAIPSAVLTALNSLGLPRTVDGVLELANRALAGQSTAGASLSDCSSAADAINNAFDECRTATTCP